MATTLKVFRRHSSKCKFTSREDTKCGCGISIDGRLRDKFIRQALKSRDWDVALRTARDMEIAAAFPTEAAPDRISVKDAVAAFMTDLQDTESKTRRERSRHTIYKYNHLLE